MNTTSLSVFLLSCLLATATAHAETVLIKDGFATSDGKAARLDTHVPEISPNSTSWQFTASSTQLNTEPFIHQSGAVRTRFNGAGYFPLGNAGASAGAPVLTLQADLTVGNLDGPAAAGAGIALGFYKDTPRPRGNEVTINFVGFIIDQSGRLSLIDVSSANVTKVHAAVALPEFSPSIPSTLRYTINTSTGAIVSVTCNGVDHTAAFKSVRGLFTASATRYAAFYGRANTLHAATGTVDNFSVTVR